MLHYCDIVGYISKEKRRLMEHHANFESLENDPDLAKASQFAEAYELAVQARKSHFPECGSEAASEIPDFDTRLRDAAEVVVQDGDKWIVPQDGSLITHDLVWDSPHDARDFVAYLYSISDASNVLSVCFHELYERCLLDDDEEAAEEVVEIDHDWHTAMYNMIAGLQHLLPMAHNAQRIQS